METVGETPINTTFHTAPGESHLAATYDTFLAEHPPGADEHVHMLAAIVDHVIARFSEPGDLVFDPFAGFGTTLERTVALGRSALGIELLPERVEYSQNRVASARVIEGDARELLRLIPDVLTEASGAKLNLILTSPPYMAAENGEADPLTAYEDDHGDYHRYLAELGLVAVQCARVVAPAGHVVWNVADFRQKGRTTHLIRDCSLLLAQHFTPVEITEIIWDRYPHDLVRDALLVFRRNP